MSLKRVFLHFVVLMGLVVGLLGTALPVKPSRAAVQASSTNPPILLIVNSSGTNKFGAYLGEILRAEGLNAFDQVELSSLTSTQLAQYDVVILAQTPLNSAQATLLTNYVQGGGALLAMRPDAQINSLFGLNASAGILTDGYLQVQTAATFNGAAPGYGLISATLQIHGTADQYIAASSASILAQLYTTATTATSYPAVVAANSGSGQAVAFMYDLPSNVAYTRQGNPANANLDTDGDYITRTVDLFETGPVPAPPWIDRNKIPIPQADEQQRLFARLVQQLVSRNHPLPQLWYFPGTAKTMLILTSDAHWNSITDYTNLVTDVYNHQGRITVYISDRLIMNGNSWDWPSNANLQSWMAEGDTFGIHPWAVNTTLTTGYNNVDSWFASTYTVPRSNTVRDHQLAWQGWTDAADIAAAHNLGIDFSFYSWGPWLQKPDGTWPHGYITGSGLPMRFVRTDGTLTSVYQQLTELADDQLFAGQGGFEGLTGSQAVSLSQSMIDASLAGNYSALTDIHHVDNYSTNPQLSIWLTGDIDYARSKGVPVWNADQWLSFTQTRHDANFTNIAWNSSSGVLSFNTVMTATPGVTATTMLPVNYGGRPLQSVLVDGAINGLSVQTIKSTNVAFVSIPAGNHSISATYSGTPPTSTPTNTPGPTPTATATATATNTPTNTPGSTPTSTTTATSTPTATPTAAPSNSLVDTSVSDFSVGTPNGSIYIAQTGDGELILTPTVGTEFSGTALPSSWFATPWSTGGTATVSNGAATVDGALIGTNTYYSPTHSLEFVATFGANTSEHVGFGTDLNAAPWAIFSTGYPGGTTLFARTNNGTSSIDTTLGGTYLGSPHRYRIDWTPTGTVYSIDGVQVASHAIAITANMRPLGSDLAGGPTLSIDWVHMSPYAATGVFVSRLLDAGTTVQWLNVTPLVSQPTATSLTFDTRTGNSTTPDDGTWSAWSAVSGGIISSPGSRYIQYRATLGTTDLTNSPVVQQVAISYQSPTGPTATPTNTPLPPTATNTPLPPTATNTPLPPTATNTPLPPTATPTNTPLPPTATNTPLPPTATNTPLPPTATPTNTPLPPTATNTPLPPTATNTPTATPTATPTRVPSNRLVDTTVADFSAGAPDANIYFAQTNDGELILTPAVGSEFSGTTLPSGWFGTPWATGGSATLSGGILTVDGSLIGTNTYYTPGHSLEFVATFGANTSQHVGFGTDLNAPPWAIFSTGYPGGTTLKARTNNGSTYIDTDLGSAYIGSSHRYRIDWTSTGVAYSIDGVQVASHAIAITATMRPVGSDQPSGLTLSLDWMRMSPYASSGVFTSRVLDAGTGVTANWIGLTSTSTLPTGTAVSFMTRTSNDGITWSSWTALGTNGSIGSPPSRYIQYLASLSTTDTTVSPAVAQVTISY
jgi:hypothetical protein